MQNAIFIKLIGVIEILLGGITLLSHGLAVWSGTNPKPLNVFLFVIMTAGISLAIGAGILRRRKTACQLLIYFSSVIVLSKILIFADILRLNGAMETNIPGPIKNSISMLYHGFLIYYLRHKTIRPFFCR